MQAPIQLLKTYYGYDFFRPLQQEIIESILSGADTLVLMPTGGGKSVCFQLPALMLKGLTIVVSPLISLMKDQVDALKSNGIPAEYINSSQSASEEEAVWQKAIFGEIKLLYIAPERLISAFSYHISACEISLFAIDEAHCISSWGHDFRPEYTQLQIIKQKYPDIPIVALTATADKITRKDIGNQLNMNNPNVFISSFNRSNLSLNVRTGLREKDKFAEIVQFIKDREKSQGIIYCMSRNNTEKVAEVLIANGIQALHYHAGMSAEERNKTQEAFMNEKVNVICATIAFGMGIDKSNVRYVIHFNLPKNMEGYYQEIGRAGRDGLPSDTVLYYNLADIQLLTKFAVESGQVSLNLEKLQRMQQFAEADICRRRILLSYFGENYQENCGNCDVCRKPRKHFDGTILIQKALSALLRMNEKVGAGMLIDVLRGSHKQEILDLGYDKIKTYGAGSDISAFDWKQYLLQMLNLGIVEIAYDENFNLRITEFGKNILYGKQSQELVYIQHKDFSAKKTVAAPEVKMPLDPDLQLFEELRLLRRKIAADDGVPPFIVFGDATLTAMAQEKPLTPEDLLTVSGVSEFKLAKYGDAFLRVIRAFVRKGMAKVKDTFEFTYALYKQGLTPEEIATQRALSAATVYSHLAQLYINGAEIVLETFVNQEELALVKKAMDATGETEKLKPIFEFLEERVPYHKIRLSLAYWAKITSN